MPLELSSQGHSGRTSCERQSSAPMVKAFVQLIVTLISLRTPDIASFYLCIIQSSSTSWSRITMNAWIYGKDFRCLLSFYIRTHISSLSDYSIPRYSHFSSSRLLPAMPPPEIQVSMGKQDRYNIVKFPIWYIGTATFKPCRPTAVLSYLHRSTHSVSAQTYTQSNHSVELSSWINSLGNPVYLMSNLLFLYQLLY